jgi:hypothetical protein
MIQTSTKTEIEKRKQKSSAAFWNNWSDVFKEVLPDYE